VRLEQSETRRDGPALEREVRLSRELRMVWHAPKQFVVNQAVKGRPFDAA
jgi:hypothetical protein